MNHARIKGLYMAAVLAVLAFALAGCSRNQTDSQETAGPGRISRIKAEQSGSTADTGQTEDLGQTEDTAETDDGGGGMNGSGYSKELQKLLETPAAHGSLREVSFSSGGDMNGSHHSVTLTMQEGEPVIIVKDSPEHWIPIQASVYRAADNAFSEAEAFIDRYHLPAWEDLPMSDMIVLDGPSTSITMTFNALEDGGFPDRCSISYDAELPEEGLGILNELTQMLSGFALTDQPIDAYLLLDGKEVRIGRDVENSDEEVLAFLTGYWHAVRVCVGKYEYNMNDPDESVVIDFYGSSDRPMNVRDTCTRSNSEEPSYELKITEIIHEPAENADCSWKVLLVCDDYQYDTYELTMDGFRMLLNRHNDPVTGFGSVPIEMEFERY